jgi:hypothetical protein
MAAEMINNIDDFMFWCSRLRQTYSLVWQISRVASYYHVQISSQSEFAFTEAGTTFMQAPFQRNYQVEKNYSHK